MIFSRLSWIISLLIVALGEPTRMAFLGPLASLLGFALMWYGLSKIDSNKKKFWISLVWFSIVQSIHLSWMTSVTYQGLYILGVWLTLSVALGVQFALLTIFITSETTLSWKKIGAASALWTIFEWSRLYFLCGFTFSLVGISLASNSYSLQMASLVGIYGMSFWVIFTNLSILSVFKKPSVLRGACCFLIAATPYLVGWARMQIPVQAAPEMQVALVQTGLLPSQKYYYPSFKNEFVSPDEQWKRILQKLKEVVPSTCHLIILPEAAIPYSARQNIYPALLVKEIFKNALGPEGVSFVENRQWLHPLSNSDIAKLVAQFFNCSVVIGLDDKEGEHFFNAAVVVHPEHETYERYDKQVLLPLVEYLPFSWLIQLTKNYGITSFFTHGKEFKLFHAVEPFCVSICYEETFSGLMREAVQKGARYLVNITNDAWFPYSNLTEQHFHYGKIRAVENGVPLLRACNTGVTAVIDAKGEVVNRIALSNRTKQEELSLEVLVSNVKLEKLFTVYNRIGETVIIMGCMLLIVFYYCYVLINKRLNTTVN